MQFSFKRKQPEALCSIFPVRYESTLQCGERREIEKKNNIHSFFPSKKVMSEDEDRVLCKTH